MQPKTMPILALMGEWVFSPLPHQTALIGQLHKNWHRQRMLRSKVKEKIMDFQEAVKATKSGEKVQRRGWEKDMWMMWHQTNKNGFLIHTHPYLATQPPATLWDEFAYVIENDDVTATDWVVKIEDGASV